MGSRALRCVFAFLAAVICLTVVGGSALAQNGGEPVDPETYRQKRDQWLREQAEQAAEQKKKVEQSNEVPAEEWVAVGFRMGWARSDGADGVGAALMSNFWVGEFGDDFRMGIRPEVHYQSYWTLNENFHDVMLFGNFYVEKNMPNERVGGMFAPYLFLGPGYEMFDGGGVSFSQAFAFDAGLGARLGHPQSPLVFEAAYTRGFGDLKANKVRIYIGLDWGF